jgi:hypothetical protein
MLERNEPIGILRYKHPSFGSMVIVVDLPSKRRATQSSSICHVMTHEVQYDVLIGGCSLPAMRTFVCVRYEELKDRAC